MTIYLDDEVVELPGENLAAVLAAARRRIEPDGRVVVEVQVDGQPVSGSELDQAQQTSVLDREVKLYTAEPNALAVSTLQQVRQRLAEAKPMHQEAAEMLQQDRSREALQTISQLVQVWLQAQQAVLHSAVLTDVDLDSLRIDGEPVQAFTDELLERLQTVKDAITNQDTVGLADTLSYEWIESADRWDRLLAELIAEIER